LECLRLLVTLRLNPARMRLISGFVDAYLSLSPEERIEFESEVKGLPAEDKEEVMEIVTSWMEDGIKQGRREGKEEGLIKGTRDGIVDILQARFKKVPAAVQRKLKTIDDRKSLKALLRQAATAGSLREFQRRLAAFGE